MEATPPTRPVTLASLKNSKARVSESIYTLRTLLPSLGYRSFCGRGNTTSTICVLDMVGEFQNLVSRCLFSVFSKFAETDRQAELWFSPIKTSWNRPTLSWSGQSVLAARARCAWTEQVSRASGTTDSPAPSGRCSHN